MAQMFADGHLATSEDQMDQAAQDYSKLKQSRLMRSIKAPDEEDSDDFADAEYNSHKFG